MGTLSIPLTQGKTALIDEEDFPLISQYAWHARCAKGKWYAEAYTEFAEGRSAQVFLHRFLMGDPPGLEVDHVNGDGLNCTRANMRQATILQNRKNRGKGVGKNGAETTSRYKGVCWKANRWEASIASDKQWHYLGRFTSEVDAARAYDAAAIRLHGAFAKVNFPLAPSAPDIPAMTKNTVGKVRHSHNTSGFRGVFLHKNIPSPKRWHATIRHENRVYSLGYHETPEEAARAYDGKARELLGAKAKLNFPDE